eukprot:symbB.v1.2.038311.t1/scaffold5924.1/size22403/1
MKARGEDEDFLRRYFESTVQMKVQRFRDVGATEQGIRREVQSMMLDPMTDWNSSSLPLILLRRAGSSKLDDELAMCTVIEANRVDCKESLKKALGNVRNVNGVFHLAGVLDDGIIGGMTEERMKKVAQPKCALLLALLEAAKELDWPLQWGLGFSSTSSLFGYAGQVNYCAANALLDHMSTFGANPVSSQGPSAACRIITVNWGPWGEAGMAQEGTKAYEQAVKEGDTPLSTSAALECLAVALSQATQVQGCTQLCACDVQWQKSQWKDLPILDHVHDRKLFQEEVKPKEENGSKESSIQGFLSQQAKTGGGNWGRVKGKSLHQLGLDSLELVQLRNLFNKKYNVNVPLGIIADPSQKLGDLASALLKFARISNMGKRQRQSKGVQGSMRKGGAPRVATSKETPLLNCGSLQLTSKEQILTLSQLDFEAKHRVLQLLGLAQCVSRP